jgi:hypothetical protein
VIESTDAITAHALVTEYGPGQVLVTPRGNVAFVHGDDRLHEVTLVIRARCAVNADALQLPTCECGDRSQVALDVVRRAPLGAFVYLNDASVESFADVLVVLHAFPNVSHVHLPFAGAGDVALLRDATDLTLLHVPRLLPPGDPTWPRPRLQPRWHTELRDRFGRTIREMFNL